MFKRIPHGNFIQQGKLNSKIQIMLKKKMQCKKSIGRKIFFSHLRYQHFKMEGINSVRDIMQKGDWMIKIDLTDAYFTLGIHKIHQQSLQFRWKGKWYFNWLPFGISVAPLELTKMFKVPIGLLRGIGICLVIYLDYILIIKSKLYVRWREKYDPSSKPRIWNKHRQISSSVL